MHVEPPEIWLADRVQKGLDTNLVWRMKKVLSGRRKAARCWNDALATACVEHGLERTISESHLFRSNCKPKHHIALSTHMDVVHGCAPRSELEELVMFFNQRGLGSGIANIVVDNEELEECEHLRRSSSTRHNCLASTR